MAATILTISIPAEQAVFLDENPEISPSKLFQAKLTECIDFQKSGITRLKEAEDRNKRITEHRDKAINFIDSKGLMVEFLKL
jgi:hypothetical protein